MSGTCSFPAFNIGSELRPLPSTGITQLPRYYEPLRHPSAPGLAVTGIRLVDVLDHAWGFPCCIGRPLVSMPPPLPRQKSTACFLFNFLALAAFPGFIAGRLLRPHFGACSAFTHVATCILAGSLTIP